MRELKESTIVLTGASSGIGRAAALSFAPHGVNLVLAARRREALEEVAKECERLGARAIVVPTDVTDAQAVERLAEAAAADFGRIDVWINNAGIGTVGEFTETPIEAHDQVVRTNLLGYMHGAYAALPYFKRERAGVLINVNSLGGWVPAPFAVSYTASKFGLRGYSEALRGELESWPDIHVCDIFPAFIDTPGIRHAGNYTGRQLKPLPPLYDPFDVAEAMVSLVESPRPAVTVGQSATAARLAHFLAPGLFRWAMNRMTRMYLRRARPIASSDGNLFAPSADTRIYGGWQSENQTPKRLAVGACVLAGLAAGIVMARRR
ncbi:MAG: SDR family oxidoreductase [Aureliella sp.]